MTTISFDGKTLCGDRRLTGGFVMTGPSKIARTSDGRLIGCAGVSVSCRLMMAWLMKPKRNVEVQPEFQADEDDCVQAIEVLKNGVIRYYQHGGFLLIEGGQFAIGSGGSFAVTAMHCGKSAYEAVQVAAIFDKNTGGEIDCLDL